VRLILAHEASDSSFEARLIDHFVSFPFQNGERLFIGAPGSWYWQGKITRQIPS